MVASQQFRQPGTQRNPQAPSMRPERGMLGIAQRPGQNGTQRPNWGNVKPPTYLPNPTAKIPSVTPSTLSPSPQSKPGFGSYMSNLNNIQSQMMARKPAPTPQSHLMPSYANPYPQTGLASQIQSNPTIGQQPRPLTLADYDKLGLSAPNDPRKAYWDSLNQDPFLDLYTGMGGNQSNSNPYGTDPYTAQGNTWTYQNGYWANTPQTPSFSQTYAAAAAPAPTPVKSYTPPAYTPAAAAAPAPVSAPAPTKNYSLAIGGRR